MKMEILLEPTSNKLLVESFKDGDGNGVTSVKASANSDIINFFTSAQNGDTLQDDFYDGTLTSVKMVLHDIAYNLRMEYFPKRRCSEQGRTRSRIMIKKIDKRLYKRCLMRNLEKLVVGREYGEDLRLLERTI
ncbi:hypothetical protein Tco_1526073 [Tanacetum coccineum]